ncbi:MAG TPA: ATP-binding protein [Thermoanaerobaculia bacterium]
MWRTRLQQRLLLPLVTVGAAALLKYLLQPLIEHESPFVLFYAAVVLSAWFGGLTAGILASLLSAAVTGTLFMQPSGLALLQDRGQLLRLVIFAVETSCISVLAGRLHSARARSQAEASSRSAAEERFRLLVESVQDYAIFMLDTNGTILTWNLGAARLKGYGADEIIGQHFSKFYPDEDNQARKPQRELEIASRTGRYEEEGWRIRKDGTRFWANVVITALYDSHGLRGFAKVTRDITERREALERERAAREAAEQSARESVAALRQTQQASRAKDEFLTTLSHELRTPMTSILGWASMMNDGSLDGETQKLATTSILQSAQAQARLIDDILDVSRAIVGRLQLELEDVDLASVANDVVANIRAAAAAKQIHLRLNVRSAPVLLRGDRLRLQQILWNLVSNAVKFTPTGGQVTVTVYATENDGVVSVRDNGAGIRPEFLPFVFGRFTQADSSSTRNAGGLGLGLAIAQELAQLHGGYVQAESAGEGRGATFTLRMPLRAAEVEEAPATVSPFAYPDLAGATVLVLEDDANARAFLSALVRSCGGSPLRASCVDEALAIVDQRHPDLVLADIAMAGKDGFEFIRSLRERDPHTPAIAVTAIYTNDDDRDRLLAAGFNEYRQKPVVPHDLAWTMARVKGEA